MTPLEGRELAGSAIRAGLGRLVAKLACSSRLDGEVDWFVGQTVQRGVDTPCCFVDVGSEHALSNGWQDEVQGSGTCWMGRVSRRCGGVEVRLVPEEAAVECKD